MTVINLVLGIVFYATCITLIAARSLLPQVLK
jgi:hypothetical protein